MNETQATAANALRIYSGAGTVVWIKNGGASSLDGGLSVGSIWFAWNVRYVSRMSQSASLRIPVLNFYCGILNVNCSDTHSTNHAWFVLHTRSKGLLSTITNTLQVLFFPKLVELLMIVAHSAFSVPLTSSCNFFFREFLGNWWMGWTSTHNHTTKKVAMLHTLSVVLLCPGFCLIARFTCCC
jgi:hypothetical protein